MLHDPGEQRLFPRLTPEQIELASAFGVRETHPDGAVLIRQGEGNYDFFVVLRGELRMTRAFGGEEVLLTVHRAGEFSGEISILTGGPGVGTATAVGETEVLRVTVPRLRELIVSCAKLAETILPAFAARVQEVDAHMQQQEKLAALGRMAAGLAHELNNPAAAVRRAAAQLDETVAETQRAALRLHEHPLQPEQQALLDGLYTESRAFCAASIPLEPLERSAREDAVADWLDDHGVGESWNLAPTLVAGGIAPERLEELAAAMGESRLGDTVSWLAATLSSAALLRDVVQSSDRISFLVQSIKQYSHMDQAPELKEVDLHSGLESTLTLLHHKLKHGVEVVREYDPTLPRVCVYPGELNQVWTNLIDNAVDALGGKGRLHIRTSHDAGEAIVELTDDGPGIAPEIRAAIWEPFFTTKGVGEGSGLGLDIVRRIVQQRHGGSVRLDSRPGETRFRISLPLAGPPKEASRRPADAPILLP